MQNFNVAVTCDSEGNYARLSLGMPLNTSENKSFVYAEFLFLPWRRTFVYLTVMDVGLFFCAVVLPRTSQTLYQIDVWIYSLMEKWKHFVTKIIALPCLNLI
jgi:hypothetical protein